MSILIVAGFDPSGGAGIVADVKVCKELNINPKVVISSIIPQNNLRVYNNYPLSEENIKEQLKSVFEEFDIKYVKIGVISEECSKILLKYIKNYDLKIILDPVLYSSTNYKLIEISDSYLNLIKNSFLITPNNGEYNILKKYLNDDFDGYILKTGIDDVLIKNNKILKVFKGKKIDREVHGTGCVYSTAITSFLSLGYDLELAIKEAKRLTLSSIVYAEKTKFGYNSNPKYINRKKVKYNLLEAIEYLKKINFKLIPEVGSNIAECLFLPEGYKDVCTLTGRIIKNKKENSFYVVGEFEFGINSHITRLLLTANKLFPEIRACMNIKYDDKIINIIEEHFNVSYFDRKKEPKDGSTMVWGVKEALKDKKRPIDIIYDTGDIGKEPMIRVFGRDSLEVVKKVEKIGGLAGI